MSYQFVKIIFQHSAKQTIIKNTEDFSTRFYLVSNKHTKYKLHKKAKVKKIAFQDGRISGELVLRLVESSSCSSTGQPGEGSRPEPAWPASPCPTPDPDE